jgi:hypothetical protein
VKSTPRLTDTGEYNTIYNGMADRLYEGQFWLTLPCHLDPACRYDHDLLASSLCDRFQVNAEE